jgi:HD superfamily phosphohydrolase YqeK
VGALPLDKVVFLADKIDWDQPGRPPYLDDLEEALYGMPSLDAAVKVYCDYLWEHRDEAFVPHPWFIDASWIRDQT